MGSPAQDAHDVPGVPADGAEGRVKGRAPDSVEDDVEPLAGGVPCHALLDCGDLVVDGRGAVFGDRIEGCARACGEDCGAPRAGELDGRAPDSARPAVNEDAVAGPDEKKKKKKKNGGNDGQGTVPRTQPSSRCAACEPAGGRRPPGTRLASRGRHRRRRSSRRPRRPPGSP